MDAIDEIWFISALSRYAFPQLNLIVHFTAAGSGGLPPFTSAGEYCPMRPITLALICLTSMLHCGCAAFNPDSKWNVNRGEYHDESDLVGKVGRGDQQLEKPPDGMGSWLYSPKARAIQHNLGVED